MITIKHLQVLSAVIRLGSVTAAARELNISQPTASKAVRRLEDVAGTRLFERQEGRLFPTSEAIILAREADHLMDEWGTYQRLITNISQRTGDRLRVAAAPTYAATIIPRSILAMEKAHPNTHIQCDILTQSDITDAAAAGKIDVGIVHYTDSEPMAISVPICKAPIVCIMTADHPLASRSVLQATDFNDWPMVGYRRDLPFARLIAKQLGGEGIPPNVSIEVNHTALIRDLVRLGSSIALADMFTLLFEPPDELVIRPIEPSIEVTMAVIHTRNKPVSRMSSAFVECLKGVIESQAIGEGIIELH